MKIEIKTGLMCLFMLVIQIGTAQTENNSNPNLPAYATKYNDPMFGDNVFIFDPGMDMKEVQTLIDSLYSQQHSRKSEFSSNRNALLFKPGTYQVDLKMGYYTHIIGLGESPDDVVILGALISKGEKDGNVTCNFWRSVENLSISAPSGTMNIWGVSQAAPMRRVHIKGDIQLHDNGWASGGFLADSKIDGTIFAGGQQQWFSRNVDLGKWEKGSWNMVFMGVPNAPADLWPENPYTVIKETPEIREKPYLVLDKSGYVVKIPKLKKNQIGASWSKGIIDEDIVKLIDFYIVKPAIDNSESINAALKKGRNLLFTPGVYLIDQSLKVTRPGTLVLGIGMATLRSNNGNPVMEVSDVDGISICGLTIDAGKNPSETLLVVGESNSTKNHQKNPTFLFDIFFRVGGYGEGKTNSCLIINSKNVYVDHTWLWRADHGKNVGWDQNTCKNGLIVNGDNVTVYALFCEHFWNTRPFGMATMGECIFTRARCLTTPQQSIHGNMAMLEATLLIKFRMVLRSTRHGDWEFTACFTKHL